MNLTVSTWYRGAVSATGPVCKCGCRHIEQDAQYRWRCDKGHFARPLTFTWKVGA